MTDLRDCFVMNLGIGEEVELGVDKVGSFDFCCSECDSGAEKCIDYTSVGAVSCKELTDINFKDIVSKLCIYKKKDNTIAIKNNLLKTIEIKFNLGFYYD